MAQARDADGNFLPLVSFRDADMRLLRFLAMEWDPPSEWEAMSEACGYSGSVCMTKFHRFQKIGLVDPQGVVTPLGLQALVMLEA